MTGIILALGVPTPSVLLDLTSMYHVYHIGTMHYCLFRKVDSMDTFTCIYYLGMLWCIILLIKEDGSFKSVWHDQQYHPFPPFFFKPTLILVPKSLVIFF